MYQTIPIGDSSGQGLIREGVSSIPRRLMQLRPVAGLSVEEYVSVRACRRASPGELSAAREGALLVFTAWAPVSARRHDAMQAGRYADMPACVHARQRTARHDLFASIEMTGLDPLADRIDEIAVGCLRGEVSRTASTGLRGTTGKNLDLTHKARGWACFLEESRERRVSDAMPRELASCLQCQPPLYCYRLLSCRHPGRTCTFRLGTGPAGFSPSGRFFCFPRPYRFPGIWLAPRYPTARDEPQGNRPYFGPRSSRWPCAQNTVAPRHGTIRRQ